MPLTPEKKLCIYGAGGFGREVLCIAADLIKGKNIKLGDAACFMLADEYFSEDTIMGVDVIKQSDFDPGKYEVVIAIGEPAKRRAVAESLPAETRYTTIIHPSAVVSEWVKIGEGSIITAGTIVTCNIEIGKHAHLNLHTTIGHDCRIGDFFTTAPGAKISGSCIFGDEVYIGTNASVKQGVSICSNTTVGMGAVVVKNIEEPGVYIGSPAKKNK